MEVTFWGVRGSIPAPGAEFTRYGGNTPCVSLRIDDELFILDAGTGITGLGRALMAGAFGNGEGHATVLLTHAHWDHIQGFPFFPPVYVPGNRFAIYGSSDSPGMMEGILEGQMNPHFSPVQSLRNLGAEIVFRATNEGVAFTEGGARIIARSVPHGLISSLAYRIEHGDHSLVYVPDAGYLEGVPSEELRSLYRGCDCLIHDCTYTTEEHRERLDRGYSSIDIAVRVATMCSVRRLVMFHYDQDYTDDQVDALKQTGQELLDAEAGGDAIELIAAAEGMTLTI